MTESRRGRQNRAAAPGLESSLFTRHYPAQIDLDELLSGAPSLHILPDGTSAAQEVSEQVMRVLDVHLHEGSRTLETGAGLSTILFALKGADHTCVVPWATEINRIEAWCGDAGISTESITFHQAHSEDLLPTLDATPLDLVLIDGAHGFPTPFIDWYYAGRRLRRGGILIIDDTQIWTGRVLKKFLVSETGWELIENFRLRSAVFRCQSPMAPLAAWADQPYVARRSFGHGAGKGLRMAVRAFDLAQSEGLASIGRRLSRRRPGRSP